MHLTATVSEVVISFPNATEIFDNYNVDYYCHGSKLFQEACLERKLDPKVVWREIVAREEVSNGVGSTLKDWSSAFLSKMILNHYCEFELKINNIRQVLWHASEKSNEADRSRLSFIILCFNKLADVLLEHAAAEEHSLLQNPDAFVKCKQAALAILEQEHIQIGKLINALREAINSYDSGKLISSTARIPFIMLQQFDRELTQRLHLENNILFPKLKKSGA